MPATETATALWYAAPGQAVVRDEPVGPAAPGEVLVRTLYSALSRGTESLVFNGRVPESEWRRMRAPLQGGTFPFPVKYGYAAVGVVEAGPLALIGRAVFCLHPHQTRFVAPAEMAVPLPLGLPTRRAVLAANMETALNGVWDAGCGPADRVAVVGAGVVGLLIARILARIPGCRVLVVDIDRGKAPHAEAFGATFATPGEAAGDHDVVFHTSATGAGLATALSLAGTEARVVEMSWYGDRPADVPLGGAFHARRLTLVSSQVGSVSPSRRPRWSHRDRLTAAVDLLGDPLLDRLLEPDVPFAELTAALPGILGDDARGTLCQVVAYG